MRIGRLLTRLVAYAAIPVFFMLSLPPVAFVRAPADVRPQELSKKTGVALRQRVVPPQAVAQWQARVEAMEVGWRAGEESGRA